MAHHKTIFALTALVLDICVASRCCTKLEILSKTMPITGKYDQTGKTLIFGIKNKSLLTYLFLSCTDCHITATYYAGQKV